MRVQTQYNTFRFSSVRSVTLLLLCRFCCGSPIIERSKGLLFSSNNNNYSSPGRRLVIGDVDRRDSHLEVISSAKHDEELTSKSKAILGVGAGLGLFFIFLIILVFVGLRNNWQDKLPAKFQKYTPKSRSTKCEKNSPYTSKHQSSHEHLFSPNSNNSRFSLDSDHTLHSTSRNVSQSVYSYYQPIEVYEAQMLKVSHRGIHSPATGASIRSIHCNRVRNPEQDGLFKATLFDSPSRATSSSSSATRVPTQISQNLPLSSNPPNPLDITLPPPIKLQPLRGPWGYI
ncbi:hypothetical protein FQN52_003666 [Onygenales sp. PD_12]|nr:hypothetical protein FQN51_001624 [Onygenales sp. PD_10]KAK2795816.1 hypothetical protein FQN52_003666 [Onygenales sp. PD_12]